MIRTNVVQLEGVPAFAYREKFKDGGSGIIVLLQGQKQPGIAMVDKRTGGAVPAANTNTKVYTPEIFKEAIALTQGMPYHKLASVKITEDMYPAPAEPVEEPVDVVIDTEEYEKLVAHYADKNGKLSYELLNKDMIRFAHSSSIVRGMIADRKPAAKIRKYIVSNKFRNIIGNDDLTDEQIDRMVELMDEVSPKGVFKELNDYLRKELAKEKKK